MSDRRSRGTKVTSECGGYEEEKQVYKSKQATVEVTVKVKKRRHHDLETRENGVREIPLPQKGFPKGSWGDLLSQNRFAEVKEAVKDVKSKIQRKELKCVSEDGDHPKTLCHRIPISDDLYLETHTHVKSRSPSSHSKVVTSSGVPNTIRNKKQHRFVAENEYLKTEIERLRQEVEKVKLENKKKKESYPAVKKNAVKMTGPPSKIVSSRASTTQNTRKESPSRFSGTTSRESKHTSTTNIIPLTEKRSGVTQTDGRSPTKAGLLSSGAGDKDDYLSTENQALRSEAAQLLAEMQKAKQEQQESIMTIKELYQLAEILKMENQQLIGAQEQHQFLQEKLVQTLTENQDLKGYLDSMMTKQKESSHMHDDQLTKMRNVIEEVKSTIAEEIQGITSHKSQSSLYGQTESIRAFDFDISEGGSALLHDTNISDGGSVLLNETNDTNASEIQRILGSLEEEELSSS